ncbi:MAG: hypothetical protein PHQ19_03225, partial [Candidatus Krumholzibacteria bacterium]|nr:hypothetical protein [Candidatus Krumholzibacteria bacterium]
MKRTMAETLICLFLSIVAVGHAHAVWLPDGNAIAPLPEPIAGTPRSIPDGSGGAIITWEDARSGSYYIYAQHVNASGVPQWTVDGVAVCTTGNGQYDPQIAADGSGGAIITWRDTRSVSSDIYAQR